MKKIKWFLLFTFLLTCSGFEAICAIPPDPINGVVTVNDCSSVTLSWESGGDTTTHFYVYFCTSSWVGCVSGGSPNFYPVLVTSVTFSDLSPNTTYYFEIRAYRLNSFSAQSILGSVFTGACCVPDCNNGIQDCNESGIDCGGPCSSLCNNVPSCSDGIQNQGETGVDYGGPCGSFPSYCSQWIDPSHSVPQDVVFDMHESDTVTIESCVSVSYANFGRNWLHGVYVDPDIPGFVSSEAIGNVPETSVSRLGITYRWGNQTANFISTNTGDSITANGWFVTTSISDTNPGNNLGWPDTLNLSLGPFCFRTKLACIGGGNSGLTHGLLRFVSTSDSYSGSWTNSSCGLDYSPDFQSLAYTLNCAGHVNICEGESYVLGSQVLTSSGFYSELFQDINGNDSLVSINLDVKPAEFIRDEYICGDSPFVFEGDSLTVPGEYSYFYTSSSGCDSTVIIRLFTNNMFSAITASVCDSYTAPDDQIYTESGTYTAVIPNSQGCDSTITINLTIKNPTSSTLTESVCDSYTAPDMQVYTQSGTYTAVIPNTAGCDSTITINLTIKNPSSSTLTESVCSFYTAPDLQVYTQSGTYTAVISNAAGCDSTITINLTIKNPTSSTLTESVCDFYTAPDLQVYTQSGTYTAVIPNALGCDSTITINLTVNSFESIVTQQNATLSSTMSGDTYQWVDCLNGNQPMPGETNQSFTATVNGEYAVIVTQNNCSDTSECILVANAGVDEDLKQEIQLFPNPTSGLLTVSFGANSAASYELVTVSGQFLKVGDILNQKELQLDLSSYVKGIYFLKLKLETKESVFKIIRE